MVVPCFRAVATSIALMVAAVSLNAQTGTVTGRVSDARTARPLAGAQISVAGLPQTAATRADGSYTLLLSAGIHTLRANMAGYAAASDTVEVVGDRISTQDLALTPLGSLVAADSLSILLTVPGVNGETDDHMCRNNLDVFEGMVRLGRSDGPRVYYSGRAKRTTTWEECLVTKPTVDDPGTSCRMLLTGSADVLVTIETGEGQGSGDDEGAYFNYKPVPASVRSNVTGTCDPSAAVHMNTVYRGNRSILFRGLPPGQLSPRVYVDTLSIEPLKVTLAVAKARKN